MILLKASSTSEDAELLEAILEIVGFSDKPRSSLMMPIRKLIRSVLIHGKIRMQPPSLLPVFLSYTKFQMLCFLYACGEGGCSVPRAAAAAAACEKMQRNQLWKKLWVFFTLLASFSLSSCFFVCVCVCVVGLRAVME